MQCPCGPQASSPSPLPHDPISAEPQAPTSTHTRCSADPSSPSFTERQAGDKAGFTIMVSLMQPGGSGGLCVSQEAFLSTASPCSHQGPSTSQ
jgi:hypothetical protein